MAGGGRLKFFGLALLVLLTAFLSSPGFAAEAASLHTSVPLAPLRLSPGDPTLLAIDGRIVVLSPTQARVYDTRDGRWSPLVRRLQLRAARVTAVSHGGRAVLLDRAGAWLRQVEIVGVDGDVLIGRLTPPLPVALRSAQAAWEGDGLLVGGIAADGAPRLFRFQPSENAAWATETAWPGGAVPIELNAQNRGRFVILADGRQWRWTRTAGWQDSARAPVAGAATAGAAIGQAHILYAFGRDGRTALYSYSTITDAWAALGALPPGLIASVAGLDEGLVVGSPRATGLQLWKVGPTPGRQGLAAVDVAIIAVYMVSMLGIGLFFYSRTRADSANEFFLGNHRIPFWAAGLSMFAGTIGSVNYLAYPAKSFETDWQYLMSKATYVGALIVVGIWLAPFFRRLNVVSVNTYLETRFHLGIRLLASGLWIFLQLTARMGIILYLPALAINTMTGLNIITCIVGIGTFTIAYTALGGMRAVVWTDVVQVFVLTGGALFAIGFIFQDLGVASVIDTTLAFHKTRALNLSFDVTQPTIWTFLALAVLEGILCFPRDQIVMQRVLSTSSPKEASWSILTFAAILLPSAILFYGIGTALFAFYRAHPAELDPMRPIDAVFPAFIGTQLPHGVVGLVVAGVLAAAMGVLSGIINSVATLLSVDFYARFRPSRSQAQIVRFSEWISVLVGVIGMAIAVVLSRLNVHSLLDLTIELGGVFGGSFAGAFPLGIFTTRANWQGTTIGIVASICVTLTIWALQAVHPYLYLAIAIFVTITVGYASSLCFAPPRGSLAGLTVFTRRPD